MARAVTFNWNPEAYRAKVQAAMHKRLDAAAFLVETHAKRLLAIEGTGKIIDNKGTVGTHAQHKVAKAIRKRERELRAANKAKQGKTPRRKK